VSDGLRDLGWADGGALAGRTSIFGSAAVEIEIRKLAPEDHALMECMLDVFAEAFEDPEAYSSRRPTPRYMAKLLDSACFVGLLAVCGGRAIGALAAYELMKFEQERSEFYIYDLAVLENYRRAGVATRLIAALKPIAASRGAKVIFVQADHGDDPAIALYSKLGYRKDVLHFDIATE
jgi:aminoglycoside 3-N-acetyltransferase I